MPGLAERLADAEQAIRRLTAEVRAREPHGRKEIPYSPEVRVVRVTSTSPTSGRYPAKLQDYDAGAGSFADLHDVWLVGVEGSTPAAERYLATHHGFADGRQVFLARVKAGTGGGGGGTIGTVDDDEGNVSVTDVDHFTVDYGSGYRLVDVGGGRIRLELVDAYGWFCEDSAATGITGSATELDLSNRRVWTDHYGHAGGDLSVAGNEVTVEEAGTYLWDYSVSYENKSLTGAVHVKTWLEVHGGLAFNAVTCSDSHCTVDDSVTRSCCAQSGLFAAGAGDRFRLAAQKVSGTDTVDTIPGAVTLRLVQLKG